METGTTPKSAGQRLGEALDAEGRGARARFSHDVDADASLVTRWINGERTPNTKQRVFIRARFPVAAIEILDWDEPAEKTEVPGDSAA